MSAYILPFEKLGRHDVDSVGGKNSSLGEMISHLAKMGVSVPGGFATTAQAYRDFLQHDGLGARISKALAELDVDDVERLAVVNQRGESVLVADHILIVERKAGAGGETGR